MLDVMQIGRNLVSLRQNMGYSLEDIAEKLNVSLEVLSCWEISNALPDITSLISLLDLYKTSIEDLLCLSVLEIDESIHQLFANHDHAFFIHEIICNQLGQYSYYDVIHLLSKDERDYALFLYINNHISIEARLWTRLSVEERMRLLHAFLEKKYDLQIYEGYSQLSLAEKKKIKEKKNEYYQNVTFLGNRRFRRTSRANCH